MNEVHVQANHNKCSKCLCNCEKCCCKQQTTLAVDNNDGINLTASRGPWPFGFWETLILLVVVLYFLSKFSNKKDGGD